MKINTAGDMSDRSNEGEGEEDFSLISNERALELFKDLPEALKNNRKIADACNLELELGKWVFPHYVVESDKSYDDELRESQKMAMNGEI